MAPDPSTPDDVPPNNIDAPESVSAGALPSEMQNALDSIRSSTPVPDELIRALLRFGRERLGMASAYLTRIRPGPGTHTLTHVVTSLPSIEEGSTQDLSETYCRTVVVEGGVLALHDAPSQGWADDPAYHTSPLTCYLGTKVVADEQLVGTVCFGAPSRRPEPFCEEEKVLLQHIAHRIGKVLSDDAGPNSRSRFEASPGMRRRVQDVSRTGGWELDVESGRVAWTRETRLIHELPRDYDPARRSFREFFPDEAYSSFQSALDGCIEGGVSFTLNLPLDTAQGHRRWVRVRGVPQYANGDVFRVTGTMQDITNRRDLERQLAVRQNQFQRLVEHAQPIVFMIDTEGTIRVSEGNDLDALGLAPGEHVGASVYELYDDTPAVLALVDQVLSGESVDTEIQIDGTAFDVWVAPYRDEAGTVSGGIGMATDISERKHREQTLRKTQERYQTLVDNFPGGVFLYNSDLECILAGGRGLSALDLSPADVEGTSPRARYPDAIADELIEALERTLAGQQCSLKQTYQDRHYQVHTLPLAGKTDAAEACLAVSYDMTERVQQKHALAESHRRLRLALNAADAGTFVYDLSTDAVTWDERSLDIYGFEATPPHQADATTLDSYIVEDDLDHLESVVEEAVAAKTGYEVTYRICRPDGERRFISSHGLVVCDESGTPDRVIGINRDVTDRKRHEEALRKERDLLDRIFQTSPTAIAVLDADGNFVRVSDQAQQILGLESEEVTSRRFSDPGWDILRPDGRPFPDEELPFSIVKETGESVFGVEHTIEWPDETRRLLSVSGAPLQDADGHFLGAVFHLDDITDRREAKRQLRRSEERFRNIFNNAALGIALTNEDGAILEANPALEHMLGYESEALAGTHFSSLTHPEDTKADKQLYQELLAGERDQYQLEKRHVRRDGEPFWGRVTMSRQIGPDGPQIVGMIEDIDAQKKQTRALRLFRRMVEHAQDAIVLTEATASADKDPEIRFVNQGFTEVTGYSFEEATGQTAELLQGPETDRSLLDDMRARMANGHPTEGETINYRKDGTPFVNHWKVAPIRDPQGRVTHFVSVHRDVTEQRQMQSQLLEVREEERRRIDQRIHDEMGGALTSLQLTIDLARMEASPPTRQHLDRLEDLTTGLSKTARSISRKLYPSTLSEKGLSGGLSLLIEKMETQHGLTVDLDLALPEKDASSLIQRTVYWIVHEALLNVARHAGTDQATVRVRSSKAALRLAIIDDGHGFDPTAQQDTNNLGLDGIRRRVEHLEGTLKIDTAPGDGSHLSVTLPLTIASVPS